MYVCICNAITDSQIKEAQAQGHHSMEQIREHLGVGAGCGRCVTTAESLLQENAGVKRFAPTLLVPELSAA